MNNHIKTTSIAILTILSAVTFLAAPAQCRSSVAKAKAATATFATEPEIIHWTKTYGGFEQDWANSISETADGGFIMAGSTASDARFGMGDAWAVRLDASGAVVWSKPYGGRRDDEAYSVIETSDGGFAFTGETESYGSGGDDVWVVKTDARGDKVWERTYGGPGNDRAFSIVQTSGGGYLLCGYTDSTGDGGDAWAALLDANGYKIWEKTFGAKSYDSAAAGLQTPDGGFIVAGSTESFGVGDADFWLIKLGSDGNRAWAKTYGGDGSDRAYSLAAAADGGFIIAGETAPNPGGPTDFLVVKTDSNGKQRWTASSGGPGDDRAWSIAQTSDGGFIMAGDTLPKGEAANSALVVKLGADGKQKWMRAYGGMMPDSARAISQTDDGGFILAGQTLSFSFGKAHAWAIKLDKSGKCPGCF